MISIATTVGQYVERPAIRTLEQNRHVFLLVDTATNELACAWAHKMYLLFEKASKLTGFTVRFDAHESHVLAIIASPDIPVPNLAEWHALVWRLANTLEWIIKTGNVIQFNTRTKFKRTTWDKISVDVDPSVIYVINPRLLTTPVTPTLANIAPQVPAEVNDEAEDGDPEEEDEAR